MNYNYYSNLFKVLSDSNRLKILDLISSKDSCACHILKDFDITQPTFTHHVKTLKQADFITSQKQGTKVMNTVNVKKLNEIKEYIDYLLTTKECNCEENCNCKKKEVKQQ